MRRILIAVGWLVLLGVTCPVAGAQQLWGEIEVPGGVAAARRIMKLGDAADRPDATWLLDFARKYGAGTGLAATAQRFAPYLEAIDYLRQDLEQWPDGLVLPTELTPREERGRLAALFDSMGFSLRSQGRQYRLQLDGSERAAERRALLDIVNVDAEKLAARLNSGARVTVPIPPSILPLPLPDWWKTEVFPRVSAQGSFMWSPRSTTVPIFAILRSQAALYTYLGLMALDAETLRYLATRPRFVRTLGDTVGGAFATFSRSVRVKNGAVELPGGAESAPIWTSLVGSSANDPERFIPNLLGAADGRLAYFYDTVASLPPPRQAFALGMHLSAADRVAFVTRVYRKFVDAAPVWSISKSPFDRPTFDPAIALMFVDILPDATIGPPWWTGLLTRVFAEDTWPAERGEESGAPTTLQADAAWLMEWLFADPAQAKDRFDVLRFAQRVFPRIEAGQSGAFGMSLRARKDMPALALALERMNVREPAVVAALAAAAHRLTLAGPDEQTASAVKRWQGALALVEYTQFGGALPSSRVTALLQALAEMVPVTGSLPAGGIAAWLSDQLLPALGNVESETQFLGRVMGLPALHDETISWEGLPYVISTRAVGLASVMAIREARQGPRLQDLLRLQAARRRLEGGVPTLDDVAAVTAALTAIEPAMTSLPSIDGKTQALTGEFRGAATAFNRVAASDIAALASQALPPLLVALDAVTDAVVPAIVYALAASPIDVPETVSDAWLLHSPATVTEESAARRSLHATWQVPTSLVRPQGGTAVFGALLALDVPFASSKLVAVPSPDAPDPQWLAELDQIYLTQAVVLADAPGDPVASQDAIDRLAAGRTRVERWTTTPPATIDLLAALETAGIAPWRANVIAWAAPRRLSGAFDALTLTELFRLGGGTSLPSSWMGPAMPLDGCLCRISNEPRRLEDLRGRKSGIRAALFTDLTFRLAELVHELDLPPIVVSLLFPLAMQDWLDQIRQVWVDDWEPVALWPARLSRARVEDYLLYLVSTGTLKSPSSAQDQR